MIGHRVRLAYACPGGIVARPGVTCHADEAKKTPAPLSQTGRGRMARLWEMRLFLCAPTSMKRAGLPKNRKNKHLPKHKYAKSIDDLFHMKAELDTTT
jgi:hypothetical protein